MLSTFQPIALSITNATNKSIQPGWRFPAAGTASDFEWMVFAGLAIAAFSLCTLNFFFLRRHEVSRRQMESSRLFEVHRQHRAVAEYRFPCWQRIAGHVACKIGFVLLAYGLASALDKRAVWIGLITVLGFICLNIRCVLKIPSHQIQPESDLIRDLGADSLDMIDLQLNLEQAFEHEVTEPSVFVKKNKVSELVDFFWNVVQKETSANETQFSRK